MRPNSSLFDQVRSMRPFFRRAKSPPIWLFNCSTIITMDPGLTGHTPGAINIPGNIDTGFIVVTRDNIDSFESDIRLDQAVEHHQLSQQLSLISSMIENVEELAIAADADGRIVYANAASLSFCGYRKEELVGQNIENIFDFTSNQRSQITSCLKQETARNFETTAIRKGGALFPAQISVSPLRSESTPRGLTIIATNISERNRSRKALIDSHVQVSDGFRQYRCRYLCGRHGHL